MINRAIGLLVAVISNASYASCQLGECENYYGGEAGNEVFFAMIGFAIGLWFVFSENSPASGYFEDKGGMAWLVIFLSPCVSALLSLTL